MEVWQKYAEAYTRLRSNRAVAREFNVDPKTVRQSLDRAKRRGDIEAEIDGDQGIKAGLEATGINPEHARMGYRKVKDEDGSFNTVMWRMPQIEQDPQEWGAQLAQAIRDGLEDVPDFVPPPPAERVVDGLCNVWPIFDLHKGLFALKAETGQEDYDLDIAEEQYKRTVVALLWLVPHAEHSLIVLGGDTTHINDRTNQTPKSRHSLDTSGTYLETVRRTVALLKWHVIRVLSFSEKVTITIRRGNHDEDAFVAIAMGVEQYFQGAKSGVTVVVDAKDIFEFQWGRCGFFFAHGDKSQLKDFILKLGDICSFWSLIRHRHAYTGHHHKHTADFVGGAHWERVFPFAPSDRHGSAWINRRRMKVDTFDKSRGLVGSMFDPIERE